MPKAINYKANSVVYFSGDFDDRVFLLKTGNIALTFINIETGAQVTEHIKTGEFFGVKSALGNFPREETAMVLTDSLVYSFTNKEFEVFAQNNSRIILQMIKVFSRQLRTIHKQLASLLDSQEEKNPEEGLFNVMTAFYNSKHYSAAKQVGERYKTVYPAGKYISQVEQTIKLSSDISGRTFGTAAGECQTLNETFSGSRPSGSSNDSILISLNSADQSFENGQYEEAYAQYHCVIEESHQPAIIEIAYIGAGKSLYKQREYVRCMQLLSAFISQNPKSTKIAEGLMYLGLCYQNMDRPDKAISFFDKAAMLADASLAPTIRELQAKCSNTTQEV